MQAKTFAKGVLLILAVAGLVWWLQEGQAPDAPAVAPPVRAVAEPAEVDAQSHSMPQVEVEVVAESAAALPVVPASRSGEPARLPRSPAQEPRRTAPTLAAPAGAAVGGAGEVVAAGQAEVAGGQDAGEESAERMVWATTREGIRGAMQEALPDLRECYAAWLKSDPTIGGRIKVRFTIDAAPGGEDAGAVTRVEVLDSSVNHAFMEGCVLNVASGLRFEKPEAALTVHYPFVFQGDR